jgi:hypothetical protein
MRMRLQADLPLSPRPRAPTGIDRRDLLSAEIILIFCGGMELATRLAIATARPPAPLLPQARSQSRCVIEVAKAHRRHMDFSGVPRSAEKHVRKIHS